LGAGERPQPPPPQLLLPAGEDDVTDQEDRAGVPGLPGLGGDTGEGEVRRERVIELEIRVDPAGVRVEDRSALGVEGVVLEARGSAQTGAAGEDVELDRGATAAVNLTDLVPGDSVDRTITVQNGGSLAFRYTVSASQAASTLLWTDATDGLQLTVRTSGGTVLYAGPLSGLGFLAGPATVAPGTSETLRYTFDFPPSASNTFQGLVQDLTVVFDAVEFP